MCESIMDIETKIDLVKKSPTEELINEQDLRNVFENYKKPNHYIGYEVSGKLHIGSLVMCGFKVNDLIKAGVNCSSYFAHWHSLINNKLGGDFEKIIEAAKYYEEAFKFFCPKLKTVQATDLYKNNSDYWFKVLQIGRHITAKRNLRCMPIMGRSTKDSLSTAQYFYPAMQAADIKEMDIQIAHAGLDQRSVHVMSREVFPKLKWEKPVLLHHHLIPGLAQSKKVTGASKEEEVIATKMSKSKPWTCIFIHDSEKEIHEKLNKAWCPPKQAVGNPILEFAKYLLFHEFESVAVERPAKFGGNIEFNSYEELEKAYMIGKLHAADLKEGVAIGLAELLSPIRKHFEKPKYKKLLDVYKDVKITR